VVESKEKVGRWLDFVNNSSPVLNTLPADPNCCDIGGGNQISVIEVLPANPDSSDDVTEVLADDPDRRGAGVSDQTPVMEVSADAADDPDHRQLVSVTRVP